MASIFYSPRTTPGSGVSVRQGLGLQAVSDSYTMLVAFVDEDVVNLVKVPGGATILELILDVPALTDQADVTWDLGDADTTGRYIAGGILGRSSAGGIARITVTGSSQYKYTVDTFIQFQIKTVPGATAVTDGVVKLSAIYTMDP